MGIGFHGVQDDPLSAEVRLISIKCQSLDCINDNRSSRFNPLPMYCTWDTGASPKLGHAILVSFLTWQTWFCLIHSVLAWGDGEAALESKMDTPPKRDVIPS